MQQGKDKWSRLRKRSRDLFDKDEVKGMDDIDVRILNSFKPIQSSSRTLFESKGGGKELPKNDREYKAVSYAVTQYIKGARCELSVDSLVRWFGVHYEWVTGRPCIDYNRWNALDTFRKVMATFRISEQELGYRLSKWIFTYTELGFEDYLNEHFSLSTLKRAWILDALFHDTPLSKSKKSYY